MLIVLPTIRKDSCNILKQLRTQQNRPNFRKYSIFAIQMHGSMVWDEVPPQTREEMEE